VRGDHEGNEVKIANALGARELRMASESEIATSIGPVGYLGPVGSWRGKIVADHALQNGEGFISGANEKGMHLRNVVLGRDFQAEVRDLRTVLSGDPCPKCGKPLETYRGIEGGHIFVLGTHYTAKMNCNFLDENNVERPIVMGCYGIGVSRLVATTIEQHHDADGIRWPMSVAPYHVFLATAGKGDDLDQAALQIEGELSKLGVEVLFDDRDERPGVKFKDADLIGIPLRVVVGKKGLAEGKVELKLRTEKEAKLVPLAEVADVVRAMVVEQGGRLRG
jgi:prolyl-tRNA synthetase